MWPNSRHDIAVLLYRVRSGSHRDGHPLLRRPLDEEVCPIQVEEVRRLRVGHSWHRDWFANNNSFHLAIDQVL